MLSLTVKELISHFKAKKLSPIEVCAACVKEVNDTSFLNAFVTVTPEVAEKQARESQARWDRGKPLGLLDGVPIAIKDNFCVSGVRTTCGSKMLAEFRPPYTATVVRKLLEIGGAVCLGKTNMDEFGMGSGATDSAFGPTRNPWKSSADADDWYISGGSSGVCCGYVH